MKVHSLIRHLSFNLVNNAVDALSLLFYYFMFKMKVVELALDEKAQSSYEIIKKIDAVHWKAKATFIVYMVVIIAYTVFHSVFGMVWIYAPNDKKPCNVDLAVGVMNVVFFVPFDLLKIYLAIYFWRLSMHFLELMSLQNPIDLSRFTILLFLIMVY